MLAICHTSYSLQTGVRSPQHWADAAAARGYTALAVADVNGLYGAVRFQEAVEKAGLKPVIGAEIIDCHGAECIVLAADAAGYRNLCRLLTARHLSAAFSLFSDAVVHLTEGVLFLSRSPAVLQRLAETGAPRENLFLLPVDPRPPPSPRALWDATLSSSAAAPIPDAWFIDPGDRQVFHWLYLLRRRAGRKHPSPPNHPGVVLPQAEEWRQRFPDAEIAARSIIERCTFRFDFGRVLLPRIRLQNGESAGQRLQRLCRRALSRKYPTAKRRREAEARLRSELDAIRRRGIADYFLFVHEIIAFARKHCIPAEVRGSAASSIVAYLLGFTHCCPLEHDLCFERFLNPGRPDFPDIDIDIADVHRDAVIDFCYRRWGQDHVAMVATVLTYRPRSAVRDAARLLRIPQPEVTRFLEGGRPIPHQDELARIAAALTGLPRHLGMHCGGLVITPCPITDVVPLARSSRGVAITHFEKDQAEAVGLLKMDLLGNSALTVIDECRRLLRRRGVDFTEPGPRYDFKVVRLFSSGDTLGVYQCESPGMRQLCRALEPATRKEVAIALSLIRPGPAAGGMKEAFIRRKRGIEPVTCLHPRMLEFLGDTYGIMLFQEDVMKTAMHLAGYTPADADVLRRAVSKDRGGTVFSEERRRFVFERAAEAGLPPETAEAVWRELSRFASYSYCKAHATVYGRLAWLTARLKAHHPLEFYTAILNGHKSMYPKRVFVWDALRHGIPVLPPDIQESDIVWTATRRGVRAGLGIIRGLRRIVCEEIVRERARRPFRSLLDLQRRVHFHGGELERLILVGACRCWGSRESLLADLRASTRGAVQLELWPFPSSPLPSQLECEILLTGIPFTDHPVSLPPDGGVCPAAEMHRRVGNEVSMVGILDACKWLRTDRNTGEEMSFVTLEDPTGLFEVVLFPEAHRRWAGRFRHLGPYRVHGRIAVQWDSPTLELTGVEEIP